MATTARAPKQRETLTLRDTTDLLLAFEQWIEDHIDEIELNGGALSDDMAAFLDEITASRAERAEAIIYRLEQFSVYASGAQAAKDRNARREKVWTNAIAGLKAYAIREIDRANGDRIQSVAGGVLRIQRNSAPSTDLSAPPEAHQSILLAAFDGSYIEPAMDNRPMRLIEHPLKPYISVHRVAVLDKKALGVAYEARRAELAREAALIGETDIPEIARQQLGAEPHPEDVAGVLADLRNTYVAEQLTKEFPGVTCTRGRHLRID